MPKSPPLDRGCVREGAFLGSMPEEPLPKRAGFGKAPPPPPTFVPPPPNLCAELMPELVGLWFQALKKDVLGHAGSC